MHASCVVCGTRWPSAYLSALPLERAEGAEAVLAGAVVEALVHLGQVLRPALLALEGVGAGLPQQGALGVTVATMTKTPKSTPHVEKK